MPPYVIFSDATLREVARLRPASPQTFARVRGVGERKLADLGPIFLGHVRDYCARTGLPLEGGAPTSSSDSAEIQPRRPSGRRT